MNDPLLGPRLKLDRAYHHLIELKRAEREYFDTNPAQIVFDTETQPGHKLAKITLCHKPPEIMHVVAGELIYQLRSALDQIAVCFAKLSKGPADPKSVYFPTGTNFRNFVKSCKGADRKGKLIGKLRHIDCDLRKAIMRTRPYNGGNEVLRAVFLMANIDKHMELIAMGTIGRLELMRSVNISGAKTGFISSDPGDLNEGIVFSVLLPEGTITPNNPNSEIRVSGQITLGDVPPYEGKLLVPFLESMADEVTRVHSDFQRLLERRGQAASAPTYWTSGFR
jgi:hypothetical protein